MTKSLNLRVPPLLALVVKQVTVASCSPGEFGAAVRAARLGGLARLFTLMPEKVAEGRELPPIASVFPAAGLGSALYYSDMATLRRSVAGTVSARRHDCRYLVHEPGVLVVYW